MPSPLTPTIYSVGDLVGSAKKLLELSFPDIWVEGEVSNLRSPASGHVYFSLKDGTAALNCVLFKNKRYQAATTIREGQHVLIRGKISLYVARSDIQLIISYIEDAGEGALRREFELLKAKLSREGLFEPARKKPIPEYPRHIGVITSPNGAALHDILSTLSSRYPIAQVTLFPATVQGASAPESIMSMLRQAYARHDQIDVLILARGGGSQEDLHAFNHEALARLIFDSTIPIICGVGHETDFSIADFVADQRAPTPTGAAIAATPHIRDLIAASNTYEIQLSKELRSQINLKQQQLDIAKNRIRHPLERIRHDRQTLSHHQLRLTRAAEQQRQHSGQRVAQFTQRLQQQAPERQLYQARLHHEHLREQIGTALIQQLGQQRRRLATVSATLKALSPLDTLNRGYAIVTDSQGHIVKTAQMLKPGDAIHTQLAEGSLVSDVKTIEQITAKKR